MLEPLALCPCSHGHGGRYAHLTGRSHGLPRSQAGALPGAEWLGQRGETCCRSKGETCHLLKLRRADGVAIGVARLGLCSLCDRESLQHTRVVMVTGPQRASEELRAPAVGKLARVLCAWVVRP